MLPACTLPSHFWFGFFILLSTRVEGIDYISHKQSLPILLEYQCQRSGWGRPATSVMELHLLRSHPEMKEKIVRNELIYYRDTHKSDVLDNPTILKGECNTWYIASCENRKDDGTFQMDHLVRVKKCNTLTWKYPRKPDTLDLHSASILDFDVDGEWDVSNNRFMTFSLRKHDAINSMVEKASLQISSIFIQVL
ncbi:unnamed protein product [Lepeophtheirus salmonis]|uniref:(salmon louse) hypothetical protein n=1 Tax=Lepeophtheirus salmonis TaxID=72036 RepID=A0A7R8CTJ0_LEPSM|nr:unnamed protein product [Lepeophtheirus salmonis]CAF2926747.1 unnamed protein product [Lepeophtheirus salmonis]